jgi:hypothetical protein
VSGTTEITRSERSWETESQTDSHAHLLLGLLRVEESQAAVLLRKHGMVLEQCREIARQEHPEGASSLAQVIFSVYAVNPGRAQKRWVI